jgi:acyl-CoA hydrolase
MDIGIPREVRDGEARVGITPVGVRNLATMGHQIFVERGAGERSTLPSTARGGTCSRIVDALKPGAGVVTSRNDVHYVATEYGVAYLHGKTIRQRAQALIDIADPKFRNSLTARAKELHYL